MSTKQENKSITIPYDYTPRPYQLPLLDAIWSGEKRRAVAVWHRRAGKDKTLLNLMAVEMMKKVGVYYYFYPTYHQARLAIWEGIDKQNLPFIRHIPPEIRYDINNSEMRITLRHPENLAKPGSVFRLIGSDNFDSIMGTNPIGCVFSEYALQDPQAWEYIRPILVENKGWAVFNYTPRGHNHGYAMYNMARYNPEWFCELLTIEETGGVVTIDDVDAERRAGMAEATVLQEFYCSFEAAIPGAYYMNEMARADKDGRICPVPYQEGLVCTYWDLGIDDVTSIWFVETVGREYHIIDYYENCGEPLRHYVDMLRGKKYLYDTHVLPHDGAKRELTSGKSIQDMLQEMGIYCSVAKRPRTREEIYNGIEQARRTIGQCWFDSAKCTRGIEALKCYRKEYDEKNMTFKTRPVHDWASHAADAFRVFATNCDLTNVSDYGNYISSLYKSSSGFMAC